MRLIDADALGIVKAKREVFDVPEFADGWNGAIDAIENAPTIEAEPVRRGEWLPTSDENKKRCSSCDVIHLIAQYPNGDKNYCPNCGAKLYGGEKK